MFCFWCLRSNRLWGCCVGWEALSGEVQGQRCGGTGMDMAAWGCAVLVGGRSIEGVWRCAARVGELLEIYAPCWKYTQGLLKVC